MVVFLHKEVNFLKIGSDSGIAKGIKGKSTYMTILPHLIKEWKTIFLLLGYGKKGKRGKYSSVEYYSTSPLKVILASFFLGKYVKAKAVITQDPFLYGIAGLIYKTLNPKTKLIVEVHSDYFINKKWLFTRPKNIIYLVIALSLVFPFADLIRVVYVSNFFKKYYKYKAKFIPSWYIPEEFKPKKSQKEYDIGYVGRLHPEKDPIYAFRLINKVLSRNTKAKSIIIGKDVTEDKRHTRSLNLLLSSHKNRITYFDSISYEKIKDIYPKIKVLIITSKNEGNPRVGFEALYSNCLIATTPTGNIYEMIKENKSCGYVLTGNMDEDVEEILNLINNYKRIKTKCTNNIDRESFEVSINRYAKSYMRFISKP